jgi:hypothetical protein
VLRGAVKNDGHSHGSGHPESLSKWVWYAVKKAFPVLELPDLL